MPSGLDGGEFRVVRVADANPAAVRLVGELDIATLPRLIAALAGESGDVELHCSGVTFCSAAAIGAFVDVHKSCIGRGAKLVVVDPSPAVLRVLGILDLDTVLNIRQDGKFL